MASKRGFGSIRRLPSRRYQARYTGPDGVEHKAPTTFMTKLDAETWLTDRRREIERGMWNPVIEDEDAPTFAEFAEEWLATRTVRGRPLKARTRDHYREILDRHLLPKFGSLRLDAITPKAVRTWHAHLLPNKPTMRAHTYSLLRTIMNSALQAEYIDANPCRVHGAGSAQRATNTTPASVTELATIAEAMPDRFRLIVLLAGWCALRYGELIELRRKDIELRHKGTDLVEGTISVTRAAIRRADGEYVVTSPKSDAGTRTVYIPPHLLSSVADHLKHHTDSRQDALLFPSASDGYLTPTSLYRHYYPARAEAGRDDLRFHDLRHTGAVLAAVSGATLADLQARLGHSTVAAAMRYQHSAAGRDQTIAEAMSKLAAGDG